MVLILAEKLKLLRESDEVRESLRSVKRSFKLAVDSQRRAVAARKGLETQRDKAEEERDNVVD